MPELALDDDQPDALVGHLHRVAVPELMRREAPSHARLRGRPAQVCARGRAGTALARAWPLMTQKKGAHGTASRTRSRAAVSTTGVSTIGVGNGWTRDAVDRVRL